MLIVFEETPSNGFDHEPKYVHVATCVTFITISVRMGIEFKTENRK